MTSYDPPTVNRGRRTVSTRAFPETATTADVLAALDAAAARTFPFVAADLKRAAEAAGCSIRSLQLAIEAGDLTAHYLGSKPLIRAVDLDEWVESLPTERRS